MMITTLLVSYLLGSVPFGYIVSRIVNGVDIRSCGSGNIGATNVGRVIGKKWGIFVFILDFLKGFFSPLIAAYFIGIHNHHLVLILSAVLPVCGHNWPVFLKFRGGKGVATSVGALSGLGCIFPYLWPALGIALIVWITVVFIFRYVSLASLLSGLSFFLATLFLPLPRELRIISFLFFFLIVIRHKNNIKNLLESRELRA